MERLERDFSGDYHLSARPTRYRAFDGGRITEIKPIGGDSLRVVIIEMPKGDYPLDAKG